MNPYTKYKYEHEVNLYIMHFCSMCMHKWRWYETKVLKKTLFASIL